jgi:hypothetical protein
VWYAQELGLLGSTAWGELNAKDLYGKAVAYLNCDVGVSGKVSQLQGMAAQVRSRSVAKAALKSVL